MFFFLLVSIVTFMLALGTFLIERYSFNNAPFLENNNSEKPIETSLTIIVPAYNEELNIIKCLKSLSEIKRPSENFKILVIDDLSTDKTFLEAKNLKEKIFKNSKELEIISSGERPQDKNWVGKNWPCYVGAQKTNSKWLLFIDADVILGKNCIHNALSKACADDIDLLSLAPKVNCNCLAEWMVQPIMTSLLMLGFPIYATNDSKNNSSFAAGPFMLFKRQSYEFIGGHEGTFDEVVEDISLAKKIKSNNLKLNFLIAIEDISLNMYRDFNSLIEGWSKNWFLGLEKDLLKSISGSIFVFLNFSVPWLLFITSTTLLINNYSFKIFCINLISALSLITYLFKRLWLKAKYEIPSKYWYLNGIGGVIVVYISLLSIYKTYTGNGWTWKGRNLFKS
ncbi:Hypothetical protein P9515_04191 [Prochlorococcus marinus str. MIT 9515]|uniref:4,4'-diaponeurosporenoate glycosyltransferase n=1 Tax=Prochlorococcus marinus (strain MIT 9515) TaxID=167542 RepID=A2BV17_PROM5|nr:glycosyltransferase family 2 protein [Prochlorococcus marinus]ABM71628.1 Hypothetical protein P9515_04191 [Prochlorococcus marinus str. MIT 9515]